MNIFATLFARRRLYRDLAEEIRQHLAEKTESLMAAGMGREEAEYAARREFGSVTTIEERGREAWAWPLAERIIGDLKFAFRQLRRSASWSIAAILTLALGIGATTVIFTVVDAVLLKPLPYPEAGRLVWIERRDHSLPGVAPETLSYPDYFDWRAQNHTLSGMAAYSGSSVTLRTGAEPQRLDAQTVSANFFQVLGVAPMLGRDFHWEDEKPGNRTVMLSYALWQSAFASSHDIAGATIRLGDHNYVVAGVMPRDFCFPPQNPPPAMWISLSDDADGAHPKTSQRGFDFLDVVGRLKPGVTLQQAKADLNLIAANLAQQYSDDKKYSSALVQPELQHIVGDTSFLLRLLFAAVALVLLIACANVASLLLARASRRHMEFALRAAIGAGRGAIMRQLLVESLLLSSCGGIAGVALAFGLLRGLVGLVPVDVPRIEQAHMDGTVLLFTLVVSMIAGLLCGVLPAWRMSQLAPIGALGEGSRNVSGGRKQHRLHKGLVIAQTAIGLVLLVSAGLLIRSFIHIINVDPGFDPRQVLTARLGVSFDKLNHDQHVQFYEALLPRLSRLPGVRSASAGWPLPMSNWNAGISFSIVGQPVAKGDEPSASVGTDMPGFFETMRIPLLSGRTFGEQDGTNGAPVVLINEAFARKYFPGENPVGKHIQPGLGDGSFDHPVREVIGVVGDIKRAGLTASPEPQYYLPYPQAVITNPFVVIRTSGDPAATAAALRSIVDEMDGAVPVYQVATLETYVSKSVAQPRFQALLLGSFAWIALILTAIGLYGLLSFIVVQRTAEIGLRMALGAQRADILGTIVRGGLMVTLAGVGLGLAAAALMPWMFSGMLFGTRPYDPATFASVTAVLLLTSVAASTVPAYRAARLDPMTTLKRQ